LEVAVKLLYADRFICDEDTFKRFLLVADSIAFMDRPALTFRNCGTIGQRSPIRQARLDGPVGLIVYEPPSGPVDGALKAFIASDLENDKFRTLIRGDFISNGTLSRDLLPKGTRFFDRTDGEDVRLALASDQAAWRADLSGDVEVEHMYCIDSEVGRRETLKVLLTELSSRITIAQFAAADTGYVPVFQDKTLAGLLALRCSDDAYVGMTSRAAPYVGAAMLQTVIPDELIHSATIDHLIDFRRRSRDLYGAWSTEVNRLSSSIESMDPSVLANDVPHLLATDVVPKLLEIRHEMKSIRDNLFAELIKKVATWEFPTLSLAHLLGAGIGESLLLFGNALVPAVPPLVDFLTARIDVRRRNSLSYLLELQRELTA
jgi:hypothetical protein